MKSWQKGLMINGQKFTFSELLAFCYKKIKSVNIPPWESEIYRFIINWISDIDEIEQHTSGTTGKSKNIRLSKYSMMVSAKGTCHFFNLLKGQTALLCLPATYIAGKMMIVRSMVGGLNLCLAEPKSTPDLSEFQSIDFAAMLPMQVMNTLNSRNNLLPINKLIIGGAEINSELENLVSHIRTEVYATFGMTETCSHVALRRLNGPDPGEAYQAMPKVKLTQDKRGCLVIAATYLPNKIITNDLVEFTGSGSFKWLGRHDNLINSGGIKVVPEEMEAIILAKTSLECAVIGIPDKKLGQKLVLVLEKPENAVTVNRLPSDFPKWFPPNQQPKRIIWVEKLPRNQVHKLDRIKLAEFIISNG